MPIKETLRKVLWPLIGFRRLFLLQNAYLRETGWIRSLRQSAPVTKDGDPVPWMNYSIVAFLEDRLNNSMNVFEYGSGSSTLFFATKVKKITSVEYDRKWYKKVIGFSPENAKILFCPADRNGKYCRTINDSTSSYDLVLIDGRDRLNCLKQSLLNLTPSGVIILDDSQRSAYSAAKAIASEIGLRSLTFSGLKPEGFEIEKSTIFYSENNCLGI